MATYIFLRIASIYLNTPSFIFWEICPYFDLELQEHKDQENTWRVGCKHTTKFYAIGDDRY